ncbi:tyrosine-type recombinase/integrase [Ktedonospora formicarum]|uniref:Tyr recombinase domain-containing protein n=1 Tax=Ktedonospora formicarum TaxID=2778364 RepID=A0A8J3ICE5_9CHLR|nr:tyrosine-type recombinase/integrase [Ktedonospora formicarum]GHO51398.1 hypothetical protein KSX_95610 [Ktedonospora formicarum]
MQRTPAQKKAKELAKYLRSERPDYHYLKSVFRELRQELDIEVPHAPKRLPSIPTEDELQRFYEVVWKCRHFKDMILIKTLFYTGIRVSELVSLRLVDVDLSRCQIRVNRGKGDKDRLVPFPLAFRELLGLHMQQMQAISATYLFESSRRHKYSDRGVRKMLERYAHAAGITRSMSALRYVACHQPQGSGHGMRNLYIRITLVPLVVGVGTLHLRLSISRDIHEHKGLREK